MTIIRDDCDERQTRVDRMIDEFRKAQSRRLANASTVKDEARAVNVRRDACAPTGGVKSPAERTTH